MKHPQKNKYQSKPREKSNIKQKRFALDKEEHDEEIMTLMGHRRKLVKS